MKAYMSTGQHGDGLTPHDRERLTRMAFEEARRILADVEPGTPDWWRQSVSQVRPIRIAGIPCSSQITLRDMPAWSALAEALAAFVADGGAQ